MSCHVAALVVFAAVMMAVARASGGQAADRGVAWQVVDPGTGRVLDGGGADVLARPALPGSTMKVPVLIAALESGTISPGTRIPCPGYADVGGRRIACVHPRVRRPLTAAEALSYSCNAFFATIGARLPRERLNSVLAALGLPRAPAGQPMALVATGLEATPVAPSTLLRAFTKIVTDPPGLPMKASTRTVVLEGLRGSALFGTAAAFGARGVDAFAKTGTADAPGGGAEGLVLAAWPAPVPTRAAVVLVAGGAGSDAAALAAGLARDGRLPARGTVAAATPGPAAVPAVPRAPAIRVGTANGNGYIVRTMGLEDYVARVLAGEAAPRSTPVVLEALAITVRTFALANRSRHAKEGFDLCDLTHCQVLREPYAAARAAAAATEGLVLTWEGAAASVYYTASCGGRSERPSNVWPGAADPPFLPSKRDTGCDGEPGWSVEIAAADLRRALVAAGYRGVELRDLRVRGRSESGRVVLLGLGGMAPGEISGQALRMAVGRTLGWQFLKSTDFTIDRVGRGYRFSGRGFGHGVGFCVIGATRKSAAGASRARLLGDYFPGLKVAAVTPAMLRAPAEPATDPAVPLASGEAATVSAATDTKAPSVAPPAVPLAPPAIAATEPAVAAGPGVTVVLPALDERERPYVAAVVERAIAAAAAKTAHPAPSRVQVVFHPTPESFTRETGEAWWSAALTRGTRIDLQPLAALRDRGTLEETLAHEVGHVVTAPALEGRAAWVKEGAAMFAAGLITGAEIAASRTAARPGCPSDPEVMRPLSAGAARDAYARARLCYARALAADRRWDEIR